MKFKSSFVRLLIPNGGVYVYYRKSNGKIVSVTYSKMGDNETFSKDEIQALTGLNQGSGLVTKYQGVSLKLAPLNSCNSSKINRSIKARVERRDLYLHLNPVRGLLLGWGTSMERRERLREYRWSGYRGYAGLEKRKRKSFLG